MKLAIMQPYFFPYLGYWQLINSVDEFVIYDDVQYIKRGWINRNYILLNGKIHLLTLPLENVSGFSLIKDIKMTSNLVVKAKILKTIKRAYSKAPYFKDVFPVIENTIFFEDNNLAQAIIYSINSICKYLGISTEILISSKLDKNNELKAQAKIIDIVKKLRGKTYINAIGGQDLYNKKDFEQENINLKFIKMNTISYQQFNETFIPNLSIIDVMMFNSPQAIKEMLNKYELI